jgi:UDP:flavonoid glycosyltransferase YjiC (YdhE family)
VVVVFYVTGHGLGHATRSIEVMHALRRAARGTRLVVRTAAPGWIFERTLGTDAELQTCEPDTGAVQLDSLRLDEDETARRAAGFYRGFEARVDAEARLLAACGADVVVGDIPPLAFAAAARAARPSVAFGNFTWDWIYGDYPRFEELAPGVLGAIRTAYAEATLALRLPLHGGFEPMRAVVRDIPLVARRSVLGRRKARVALGCTDDRPVVLGSFGGHGLDLPYERIAADRRFVLVLTDYEARAWTAGENVRHFAMQELAGRGIRYEDLVAAADAVVSKPGYGIVSECIANGAALLYTSRGRFIEQEMFVREMPRVLRCRYIEPETLRAGRWWEAIRALLDQPPPPERLEPAGAEQAAAAILGVSS